jgi:hypothetical protein
MNSVGKRTHYKHQDPIRPAEADTWVRRHSIDHIIAALCPDIGDATPASPHALFIWI